MKQGETMESQVKGEIHEKMTNNKNVGVWSFWKWKTSEIPEFPEIE